MFDADDATESVYEISNDKAERMLQLRLLHNYYGSICKPFRIPQSLTVETAWQEEVSKIAFENDNLLYAMFAISATSLLRGEPSNTDLRTRRDRYLALALHQQRNAVNQLSELNADAILFAALLIQMNSFAMLHKRIDTNGGYHAVIEWLSTGPGAGQLFGLAAAAARRKPDSKFKVILDAPPAYAPNTEYHFRFDIPPQSRGLLHGSLATEEGLSPASKNTYEKTLRYLGTIHNSVTEQKPSYFAARQTQGFSLLVPKDFIKFVQQERPLALAILAHFFAYIALVEDPPWWVSEAPYKAIMALSQALQQGREKLPSEMDWPCVVSLHNGML